jgi:hypothetical protein
MNLLLGQVTLPVAIGCMVALRWARSRPLIAALGLALAMMKPTYGIPLAALMLVGRGDVAAPLVGGAIAAAGSLVAAVPLVHAAGGVGSFVTSLGSSAAAFAAEDTSNAWSSIARIDATALVARLIGRAPAAATAGAVALVVLAVAVVGLRRLVSDRSAPAVQLGVGLVCLSLLVASYHQAYDALLVAQPAVALAAGRWGRGGPAPRAVRWTVLALLAVPAINYLATRVVIADLPPGGAAWLAITAANPAALLAAWAAHVALCWRVPSHQAR